MFIDKDSIIMDNVSMGQYLTEVKYGYYKLWSQDSGRNLAGEQTGTLVGIFPKLVLQFRKLTRDEFEIVCKILDKARQNTTYYDPNKKQNVTMLTYTGDYETINRMIIKDDRKIEPFTCSVISIRKRS